MSSTFKHHPSSFRDPSGFIFEQNGILYRQVNQVFKKDFDHFIESGLCQHLIDKNILIAHQTINKNLTDTTDWHLTLQPEVISFISYPYEWCFNMLKDAALLTLELAKEAMRFGMMLKDASSYNIQLHKGQLVFIDSLSFEKYNENNPWIAYRQFCEHFFAPLALMHYLKVPLQDLLIAYPEGIPLDVAKKMLPFKSKINLHTSLHLHMQASLVRKSNTKEVRKIFSRQKMQNLLRSLEEGIRSFSLDGPSGVWSNYYQEANQREDYVKNKKYIVSEWLNQINANSVLDAGANDGEFSKLVAEKAHFVISADFDHFSIDNLYKKVNQDSHSKIHPLILDFVNPSPSIGVNNEERTSFLSRAKVDLTLALALIHHLAIGKNIPFESIAKMFSSLGKYLIIEFVPKQDDKIQLMLKQKNDVYHWYQQENFLQIFSRYFTIIETKEITSSGRILYLMKRL